MSKSILPRPVKRFTVLKDDRNGRWGVFDTLHNEWNVWPKTKKQALETAEDWNITEWFTSNRALKLRASFRLIMGGAA